MPAPSEAKAAAQQPPVVLDAALVEQLQDLAEAALRRAPDVAERLLDEIGRASLRRSSEMPPDVVTIGSTVTYRDEATGREQEVVLVLPTDADIARRCISVLTPVGAALLGLQQGASIRWPMRDGRIHALTVLRVAPPAAGTPEAG